MIINGIMRGVLYMSGLEDTKMLLDSIIET